MPISFTTLQIYDQYLTTYRNKNGNDGYSKNSRRSSRFDTHNADELKSVYSSIQWKNRFAPLYLNDPTPRSIAYAVHLKESAQDLKQTIHALSGEDDELFSLKTAYSDNEALASVEYVPEDADGSIPADFDLKIRSFASPQVNTGTFLPADQPVEMRPDNYSFDILTSKLHYELQFTVNEGETHRELQNKLARLINNSDLGVHAKVLENRGRSALEITSDATGMPFQGVSHFTVTDESTSYNNGIVNYLGLNKSIQNPTNAVYTINGAEQSSYSNTINAFGAYHITLHPEEAAPPSGAQAKDAANVGRARISLYADSESLSNNIETFVDGYNHFVNDVLSEDGENTDTESVSGPLTRLLSNDMSKFLRFHRTDLEKYGISINEDSTLEYSKAEGISDPAALKSFGSHVLRKLNSIAIDPMEYVDRRICAYSNPSTHYINPYMTSIYTGMLFNAWT